jgi:signal transduction histidine kinase
VTDQHLATLERLLAIEAVDLHRAVVTVQVRQHMRGDEVWGEITVADQGPGIPPDSQSRIFERFATGAASLDSASGCTWRAASPKHTAAS